jgi:hypothetical protein
MNHLYFGSISPEVGQHFVFTSTSPKRERRGIVPEYGGKGYAKHREKGFL